MSENQTPVQAGQHVAMAIEDKCKWETSQNGKPYFRAWFRILQGPDEGREVTGRFWYTTDKARKFTLQKLLNCGCEFRDGHTDLAGIDRNDVLITVEHDRDDDGRTWAEVSWVNPVQNEAGDDVVAAAFANFDDDLARAKG